MSNLIFFIHKNKMSKNGIRKTLTKSTNYCNLIIVKIYIFNSIKKEVYEKK